MRLINCDSLPLAVPLGGAHFLKELGILNLDDKQGADFAAIVMLHSIIFPLAISASYTLV